MGIVEILTAGLEFLKKTALIYCAVFLAAAFVYLLPDAAQKYLGLDALLSGEYRGWVSGIGILAFFLWLTSLWPVFKEWRDERVDEQFDQRMVAETLATYRALPVASRAVLTYYVAQDKEIFKGQLDDPGMQLIMDTGWVFHVAGRFHFHSESWSYLKKSRQEIREDHEHMLKEKSPDFLDSIKQVRLRENSRW